MTQPTALEAYAINLIEPYIKRGDDLDSFLTYHLGGCAPAREGQPAIYYSCGGHLYLNKDGGGATIKLKRHEIGVIFYFADGHSEFNVFDIRALWDTIKNPRQLELWPELVK